MNFGIAVVSNDMLEKGSHMSDIGRCLQCPISTPSCAALGGWSENFNSVDPWDFSRGPPWWVAFWAFPHEKRERFEWETPGFFPCSSYSSSQKSGKYFACGFFFSLFLG